MEFVDGKNMRRNLPELQTLVLSGCGIRGWNVLGELGVGCPKLEVLSLVGNPVTSKFLLSFSLVVRKLCIPLMIVCLSCF